MEIIIKIPEEDFERCKKRFQMRINIMGDAIANGTLLPKGHGRLIDADAYIDKHEECGWLDQIAVNEFNAITPTIKEADKESD